MNKNINDLYDHELRKIDNLAAGPIKCFGYCNKLSYEMSENYGTRIICIKYTNSDDWVEIYNYKYGIEYDCIGDGCVYNHDCLSTYKLLNKKELKCILSFIYEDKNAMSLFNEYINSEKKTYNNTHTRISYDPMNSRIPPSVHDFHNIRR